MKFYTLGFLFSLDRSNVALISKNRPDWQRGKLNGIGGHIEATELAHTAMEREFLEETGVEIKAWKMFGTISSPAWEVFVFKSYSNRIYQMVTTTDEQVGIYPVEKLLDYPIIDNLQVLIPAALIDNIDTLTIEYK
jgi:8-oxo-dGTP diphosphatase